MLMTLRNDLIYIAVSIFDNTFVFFVCLYLLELETTFHLHWSESLEGSNEKNVRKMYFPVTVALLKGGIFFSGRQSNQRISRISWF